MNLFRSKTTTLIARNSVSPWPLRYGLFLIGLALAWFALTPTAVHGQGSNLFASVNGVNGFGNADGAGLIFKYTATGAQSVLFYGLNYPRGFAFDSAGNLFVATTYKDTCSNTLQPTILKITPGGVRSNFGSFSVDSFLQGLAIDTSGNVFVVAQDLTSPTGASTIFKFTPAGTQSTFASLPSTSWGLAFDSAGNLFAADGDDGIIYKFTPVGTGSVFGRVADPIGLAFDRFGNLFVSTEENSFLGSVSAVFKFTPSGVQSTFATGLNNPRGLAFDSAGNLFVAELNQSGPGDILRFTPGGQKSVFASGIGDAGGNSGPEWLSF